MLDLMVQHGGPQVCASKIASTDLRIPIGGPAPLSGGMFPSHEVLPMAAVVPVDCIGSCFATGAPMGQAA